MQDTLKQAQEYFQNALYDLQEDPILLLVSGGSAFRLLDNVPKELLGKHLTLSVLDERFSREPTANNFLQLTQTEFYGKATRAGCNLIHTLPNIDESIEMLASRFERDLRSWKAAHPDGKVLVTQGVGHDGHTAGIMPYPKDIPYFQSLFESEKWVVGYNAGSKNQYPERVTTTITFLKDAVDLSIVYAVGQKKRSVLQKLFAKNQDFATLPVSVVWQMKQVKLFTDYERAQRDSNPQPNR